MEEGWASRAVEEKTIEVAVGWEEDVALSLAAWLLLANLHSERSAALLYMVSRIYPSTVNNL